jgi:tRNA modification GTPase
VTAEDTIAAVATPPGSGGVGIVRLSGPAAGGIVARLLGRDEGALAERRMVLGVARDPATGERLDEVLAVLMRGPRSYTGEDVAEVHAHGGALNLARLLRAALACGARPAEPGEFTRRAFTNGRLDLVGAEAVADVIGAASERALRAAQAQLAGALGERVRSLRARAVALLAEIEASIDFPEEDLDCLPPGAVAEGAEAVAQGARGLAATFAVGRALREGIDVVIVGAPNVGKSSLLNALCGEERAIVAAEPGTTRDYVEARRVWDGIPVTLVDTAGERSAASELEQRGVSLGRARAAQADVIVRVRDATAAGPGAPGGEGAAEEADGRVVEAWNKVDLRAVPPGALGVSALTGAGLDELRRVVVARVVGAATEGSEAALVTTERQRALLEQAAEAAGRAAEAARARRPVELVAADVREAVARLGAITGEEVGEDLLDALFARFCIGK